MVPPSWSGPAWIRSSTLPPRDVARAFCVSFLLLGSYYLVRPVRDDIGVQLKDEVDELFGWTFLAMLVLSPLHGIVVARLPRRSVVPAIFWISSATMLALHWAFTEEIRGAQPALFVFFAVYNLFCVSSFWSWMNERFHEVEARRWFGPVAVGGTIGALFGSRVLANLGSALGNWVLPLSAGILALAGLLVARDRGELVQARIQQIGGGVFAGARRVFSDPYLAGIAGYVFLMTVGGTLLYVANLHVFSEEFGDDSARNRRWFAEMDFASNCGALVFQLGIVGPWMLSKRVTPVLAALPVFAVLAFPLLGAALVGWLPLLWTVVVLSVATRIGKYGLAKPSRESMYTVVSPEDRFKAKTFLDTVVYRGGDWVTSRACAAAVAFTGSIATLVWGFAPLALLWAALAVWLGRRQAQRADLANPHEE